MIHCGNSLEVLKTFDDNSIDAVVTDPPYGLSFMGKKWDYDVPTVELWQEVFRVLKPGGHLLAFAGTRTQHRMAVNIEDAGFEIRDMIAWIYGSGFPKSLNIGKQGVEGYEGWGTALKPALEPITVARKPIKGSVANNVLEWGTGGINIDGCRVGTEQTRTTIKDLSQAHGNQFGKAGITYPTQGYKENPPGRFPANLIHDGSDEVVGLLGEPARFFYTAKASKSERNKGLEGFEKGCTHPTVKPVKLMQYLVRLVTPKGGTVLDPFNGSGTTGIACKLEGFDYIGIELDPEYVAISEARIAAWEPETNEEKQMELI